MAVQSNNTALALAIQPVKGTFTAPTLPADLLRISNLRVQIDGITIANDEYTGSAIKDADAVAGKRVTITYNVKLRPPGGSAPPAAGEFVAGRLLQAAKLTEAIAAAAIPVAPEAVTAATETSVTLGAGAAATENLYRCMPLQVEALGASFKDQLTAIVEYDAGKVATLPQTLDTAPTGSNYQILPNLSYYRSITPDDPLPLSQNLWFGGERWDLRDCNVTGFRAVVPTSTRDTAAYPEFEVTLDCTINETAKEAPPAVPSAGPVPLFRDGQMHIAQTRVGGSTFTVDLGIQSENPPNPNEESGSEPAQLVSSTATVNMTRQKYTKDVLDTLGLADAQGYHSFAAWWGAGPGSTVMIIVPEFRFNYQSPDLGGTFVNESGDLLIDVLDRGVSIVFPYAAA